MTEPATETNNDNNDKPTYDIYTSLSVMVQGVKLAQKNGAYSLDDAVKIWNAVKVIEMLMENIKISAQSKVQKNEVADNKLLDNNIKTV